MSAEFWKHASIPFVAGLVGWGTNWVAVRLTFRPLEFVGLRPYLGWQGIIPGKAGKMARIFVEKTMFRLGPLQELFQAMQPEAISRHVSELLDRRLEGYTDEVMFYGSPGVWKLTPRAIKESVYTRVRERMPQLVDGLVREITERIEELVDFKEMLVDTLEADRNLLNRLFLESGAAEFRFIVRSGLYFGFLFGLVQLTVWSLWKSWWTLQGLFLKRQHEVSAIWSRLVASEIVTLQRIAYTMVYGSRAERTHSMIRRHIQPIVDEVTESMAPLAGIAVGRESLDGIRRDVGDKAVEVSTDPFDHWPFNRDRARLAERMLGERMADLPSREFQDLLRPCFQEDEIKLIVLGGALGLLAGVAQLFLVFGGSW